MLNLEEVLLGVQVAEVRDRVAAIDAARAAKDYSTADSIRAELQAEGWIVETTAGGTSVRR